MYVLSLGVIGLTLSLSGLINWSNPVVKYSPHVVLTRSIFDTRLFLFWDDVFVSQ